MLSFPLSIYQSFTVGKLEKEKEKQAMMDAVLIPSDDKTKTNNNKL